MHPPFFSPDHRSVAHTPHPVSHKRALRRSAPGVLLLTVAPVVDNPTVPTYRAEDGAVPVPIQAPLRVVPAPTHRSMRDVIGRWLIRMGQRIMIENRPGERPRATDSGQPTRG